MTEEESKLKQEELKYKEEMVYGVAKKVIKRKQTSFHLSFRCRED
jgi:hypothetical protein